MRRATIDERKRFATNLARTDRETDKPRRFRDVCLLCDQPTRAVFCSPICAERGLQAAHLLNGLVP